jgi:ribonuclease HI
VIDGLSLAKETGAAELECFIDSQLVVRQLKGEYKIKNPRMRKLWKKAKELEKDFEEVFYIHVPRSKNSDADDLVNEVLDSLK